MPFVSLEVPPYMARDTEGTIKEARRLYTAVGKQNCLIKILGTKEGLLAIEQMLYEGININVTLLFLLTDMLKRRRHTSTLLHAG